MMITHQNSVCVYYKVHNFSYNIFQLPLSLYLLCPPIFHKNSFSETCNSYEINNWKIPVLYIKS